MIPTYGLDLKRISSNDEIESYKAVSTKATNDLLISGIIKFILQP